jgi:hypothetical protein
MRTPFSLALVLSLCAVCVAVPGAGRASALGEQLGEQRWHVAFPAVAPRALAASLAIQPAEPDEYESDDTAEAANELVFDEVQQRSFHVSEDNDWVWFSLTADDRVLFSTGGSTCDTYLYLYAPDAATIIAEDDDGGGAPNAAIRFTAPEDGLYYGRVRQFGAAPTPCPSYQLSVTALPPLGPDAYEPDDGPTLASPITLDGSPQERSIHVAGDRDWVAITAQTPTGIVIATGGNCDLFMTLYDRNGTTTLVTDDDSGSGNNPAIAYTLSEPGTYFAEVRHFNATDGTCDEYLFGGIMREPALPDAFEADDNANQAKPLPLDGSPQQRSFHVPDDDDWVSFPATAGDRVFLATEGSCDTYISVFGPDRRTLLREDDDAGGELNAALLFTARETGTHYARVRAFGGAARPCPSYELYGALVARRGTTPTPTGPGTPAPTGVTPTAVPGTATPTPGTPGPSAPAPATPVPGAPSPTTQPLFPIVPTPTGR